MSTEIERVKPMTRWTLFRREFLFRFRTARGIRFLRRQFAQRFEIAHRLFQFAQWIQQRTQPRNFLDVALSPFAIRPKIRRRHALFQRAQLLF